MDYQKYAEELVNQREGIIAAYGYGSAFNHQQGYTKTTKKSMDMIFVVDNIKKWNKRNMLLHKQDYSTYTKAVFKITPKCLLTKGTSVIYNVVTDRYQEDFKYGLIEEKRLLTDLYNWKHFYVCGRMQKPLHVIKGNNQIDRAIKYNRGMALLASLIILDKEVITVQELLEQICMLSYSGDVRTLFAENPNKVKNIVQGSYDQLKDIYCYNEYIALKGDKVYVNLRKVYNDYFSLPASFYKPVNSRLECSRYLKHKLQRKNLKESIEHPIKQFYVSGFSTCKKYMNEKMKKKTLK